MCEGVKNAFFRTNATKSKNNYACHYNLIFFFDFFFEI